MMNKRVRDAMNVQIQKEIFSSYLYLSMAAYFDSVGLDGMASWMRVQSQEELFHAMKFFDHLKDREGRVELLALEKPATEWASPLEAFKAAYEHEKMISASINNIMTIAHEEKDYAAFPMLSWFVEEQIEEEASVSKIVGELERLGSSGHGMMMIDRELGVRTFTYPAATTAE
ncbi:MAG TPA: ferritin [bacterium]|jgi:ferritin|nr:ferritin [Myxococcales bacterium]OQA62283.1 MAG: Ferritin [bacterium ADurb.Bin270]HPW45123.1 ferritin [bacterium]HQC51354.1 ferritin [bacterium]HQG13593.1 ferritin [bacterium]